MSTDSFLHVPGQAGRHEVWALGNWLPHPAQVRTALQLRIDEVVGARGDESENEAAPDTTSMRQGIGLIVALGLAAGALPFLVNWFVAARAGTALPLVRLAQRTALPRVDWLPLQIWADAAHTIAGIDPRIPGWLAALLSALGAWVNWPLGWLSGWLVYGLAVLFVAKLLGAPTTLSRFYAATAYAWTPLLLTALSPIPCLGALAGLVAVIWMVVMYIHAVHTVSGLEFAQTLLAVILPGAVAFLLTLLLGGALFLSIFL
ncbi:MAG TPA: Yip1 family protein [Caldilineaceae bacterium]|nr:Yip1 family protein [Caldilineaceae bacterium]